MGASIVRDKSDLPSNKVLGGLYASKLQDSSQVETIMALYNQEILREGGKRDRVSQTEKVCEIAY